MDARYVHVFALSEFSLYVKLFFFCCFLFQLMFLLLLFSFSMFNL